MQLGLVFIRYYMYNMDMNFIKKNWRKLVLLSYVFFIPAISFAQTGGNSSTGGNSGCDPSKQICNPLNNTGTIPDLIEVILRGALTIGIPVVALAIIYSGFLFVAATGNPEKIDDAKRTLMYTLIGAGVLLGALAIAKMISFTIEGLGA